MSTRCQIHVNNSNVLLYRHQDGYPEGVLPDILPTIKRFIGIRGFDVEYLPARLIVALVEAQNKVYQGLIDRYKEDGRPQSYITDAEESRDTLSIGVTAFDNGEGLAGDIEYLYVVEKDRVRVMVPTRDFYKAPRPSLAFFKLLKDVDFDGNPSKPPEKRRKKEKVA